MQERTSFHTLIMGLGVTGLSVAKFLRKIGVPFAIIDSRAAPPMLAAFQQEFPEVSVYLGSWQEVLFRQAQEIVISPGLAVSMSVLNEARAANIPIIGDIELFARHAKAPVIAITGSNGKSTVTTLVGELLKAAGLRVLVGGNLGTAALDLLSEGETDYYVLELSSFQLETTYSLRPIVATLLNISPDHLDRYADIAEYTAAKQRIFQGASVAIVNKDDPASAPIEIYQPQKYYFTLEGAAASEFGISKAGQQTFLAYDQKAIISTTELGIKGSHNWANALASLAICHAIGIETKKLLLTLRQFKGLAHRCQLVETINGVAWYNDSKATNIGACIAAIQGIRGAVGQGNLVLIAGGDGKGADFSILQPIIKDAVSWVIVYGKDAEILQQALSTVVRIQRVADLKQAVEAAREITQPGDTVLLAPACASLDMFVNYEARGKLFESLVLETTS